MFSFAQTAYRFVNRETRELFSHTQRTMRDFTDYPELHTNIIFQIETLLFKFEYGALQNAILQKDNTLELFGYFTTLNEYAATLPQRTFDLLPFSRMWDIFTTSYFTMDYSRETRAEMASVLSTFSETLIKRAIGECEAGKPISYLTKILERMRAETVPTLRREEMFQMRVNSSTPTILPTYRNPGFISNSLAEEQFFRALQ